MRLSKLQKYILEKCHNFKSALPADFYDFYKSGVRKKIITQIVVHQSLDNLLVKGLLEAYGKKTAKKWAFYKVKLTSLGRKIAIKIIKDRQRKLPIK